MIWIILLIAVVGFGFWLFLHLGTKVEKNSVGGKVAGMVDKFQYIGDILHQEKTDIVVNEKVKFVRCIKQDEFLFCYDSMRRLESIVLYSGNRCLVNKFLKIFHFNLDNIKTTYSYTSGSWDSFLLNAIHELHQRAMKKDQDELLSESCKQVYVENYFNELFAKKGN